MVGYLSPMDIMNKALVELGSEPIKSVNEISKNNRIMSALYPLTLKAELERNIWASSIKKCALYPLTETTVEVHFEPWNSGLAYLQGQVVADDQCTYWRSKRSFNLNNPVAPGPWWEQYFGPLTADVWNKSGYTDYAGNSQPQTYWSGDLVYMYVQGPGPGAADANANADALGLVVFSSNWNGNGETPNVPEVWSATQVYDSDIIVADANGNLWRSLITANLNNEPLAAPAAYSAGTSYSTGQTATGSDNFVYQAKQAVTGVDPVVDAADEQTYWEPAQTAPFVNAWTQQPALPFPAASGWTPQICSVSSTRIGYPIGTGPIEDSLSRNVYRLPAGWLREAPQDPTQGSVNYLGAPSGIALTDWNIEGNYLTSRNGSPILYRFSAMIQDVCQLSAMCARGIALSLAMDACESITQSTEKLTKIEEKYKALMGDARTVNGIITGADEPPLDDLITCRL
jgi:hypothetical protein